MKKRLQNIPRPRLLKRGKSDRRDNNNNNNNSSNDDDNDDNNNNVNSIINNEGKSNNNDMNKNNQKFNDSTKNKYNYNNNNNNFNNSNSNFNNINKNSPTEGKSSTGAVIDSDKDWNSSSTIDNYATVAVVTPDRPTLRDTPPFCQHPHPPSAMDTDDTAFLQQQLRDAQRVVRAVLGESNDSLDSNASLQAIRTFAKMQKEVQGVKKEFRMAVRQRNELETLYTNICIERNTAVESLTSELLHSERMVRKIGLEKEQLQEALAVYSGTTVVSTRDTGTNELELEANLEELQTQLLQRQELVHSLQKEIRNARQETQYIKSVEPDHLHYHIDTLKAQLAEAHKDVDELEQERQMNMAEIVELSKELRNIHLNQRNEIPCCHTRDTAHPRAEQLEQENLILKTQLEDLSDRFNTMKQQWDDEKETMEVDVTTTSCQANTVQMLKEQLSEFHSQADDWQQQFEAVTAELRAAQVLLKIRANTIEMMQQERAEEIMRDQEYAKVEGVMLEHTQAQLAKVQAELNDAKKTTIRLKHNHEQTTQLMLHQQQRSSRSLNRIVDTPTTVSVTQIRVDVLTAKIRQLKRREKESTLTIAGLQTDVEREKSKVQELNLHINELNSVQHANDSTAQVETLTPPLITTKSKHATSEMLDLTMQVHSGNATIKKLALELTESKFEIERLTTELESTEVLTPKILFKPELETIERLDLTMQVHSRDSGEMESSDPFTQTMHLKQLSEISDLNLEIRRCHGEIQLLSNDFLESQKQVEKLTNKLAFGCADGMQPEGDTDSASFTISDQERLLSKEEQQHQLLLDQVDELRSRLQLWQTQVEDLELERNFNQAKVYELNQLLSIETKSDAEQALHAKAMDFAEVSTKLEAVITELTLTKLQKEKLEQECKVNKAKVAELSRLWDNQTNVEKVKEETKLQIGQVMEALQKREEQISKLEVERERYVKKATCLSIELAGLKSIIDELTEKIDHQASIINEKVAIIKSAGINSEEVLLKLQEGNTSDCDESRTKSTPLSYLSHQYNSIRFQGHMLPTNNVVLHDIVYEEEVNDAINSVCNVKVAARIGPSFETGMVS